MFSVALERVATFSVSSRVGCWKNKNARGGTVPHDRWDHANTVELPTPFRIENGKARVLDANEARTVRMSFTFPDSALGRPSKLEVRPERMEE